MESSSSKIVFRHSFLFLFFSLLSVLFISFTGSIVYADTFIVSNSLNDGPGSLRAAIASADSSEDVISFDVTGIITLSSELKIENNGLTILGPGAEQLAISGNNTCSVFFINTGESVDISGLSIVSGNAGLSNGGGIFNIGSNLTVTNCTFSSNTATAGGGIYNPNSSATLTNCTFSSNNASEWGGAIFTSQSESILTNCTFSSNTAPDYGGGIYNVASNLTITKCSFSSNKAASGGGIYNVASRPTVTNSTFDSNSADFGSGMYNFDSSPTVTNCTFSSNNASEWGGGMHNYSSKPEEYISSPTVTNCTFTSNTAMKYCGGGISNNSSNPTVTNCTFYSNSAYFGGGIYNVKSSPSVINCTFSSNSTAISTGGGGIYNYTNSNPTVKNCIFWNAKGGEIFNNSSSAVLSFCVVQNDDVGIGTNSSNITSADPMLQELADNGGLTWTCALGAGSPAIDAGTDVEGLDEDQRGHPRPWGSDFDIGAYEVDVRSFTIDSYYTSGGTITPDSATVFEGESMDFTVSPVDYFHIEEIYVDRESIPFEPVDNIFTYTFSNVSSDHTISADFALDEYVLSVDVSGSGTVAVSPDLGTYPHGTEVTLTANPAESSLFASWQGTNSGSTNPQTLTMTGPEEVTALFTLKTFTITLDPGNHGNITGLSSVTWGSTPTYTIECDTGYAIDDVLVDGVSQESVNSLTLDPVIVKHTISATFAINQTMIEEAGLRKLSVTTPGLSSELVASLDLPGDTTSDDLDLVSEDVVISMDMREVTAGGIVDTLIESRENGEIYVKGVSFDIAYDQDGIEMGVLPLHLEMEISKEEIGEEYTSLIDDKTKDKGLKTAFLDHVGILKVISPDIYDLLEEAWEDYAEEEAKAFFEVSADEYNYYVGLNLMVADEEANNSKMAVQAISDNSDHYFFIFDGEEDGHCKDPIVAVRKPLKNNEGGGCNISALPVIGLLLGIPIILLSKKMK